MSKLFYLHSEMPGLRDAVTSEHGVAFASDAVNPDRLEPLDLATFTIRLARKLGVLPTVPYSPARLPYSDDNDNVVFDAPLATLVAGRRVQYLRGWKSYASCVKCYNALGLMGDHVLRELRRLQAASAESRRADVLAFARSRRRAETTGQTKPLFDDETLGRLTTSDLDGVDLEAVAIWKTFARRPIVCSTSSNMGISLHEALRFMQSTVVDVMGRRSTILNDDEGRLIIWCPDEQADFMNPEKTEHLRSLETEQPPLTVLHTYINRKQRDPGALRDALEAGGYFFPTNPQSTDEMQNLLANSLGDMAKQRRATTADLLADANVQYTLASLGCTVDGGHVVVRSGVDGGLYGLMAAYLLMLDETLPRHDARAVSTWNQASIGAALAAAILADQQLRRFDELPPTTREALATSCPGLTAALRTVHLGTDVATQIHGVFDLANLQSLGQLLGVVVERHLSGRGTAFVGLGSSSYSNGNRCYEILKDSFTTDGPFRGRDGFHPATHTLNPVAQALVYADDLRRASRHPRFESLTSEARLAWLMQHARKPEPAGAAAMAGYLLTRLDGGTLSLAEVAATLRLSGFDAARFLEFAGFNQNVQGTNWFLQEATEEGIFMEGLARITLQLLDLDVDELLALAARERAMSRERYQQTPIDPPAFEARNPMVTIYLTGDNTRQPRAKLVSAIYADYLRHRDQLDALVEATYAELRG